MRRFILLMLTIVCLRLPALPEEGLRYRAQPDLLQQPVTVRYQNATLLHILHDLHDRYQIRFAYSNNEILESPTFSLQAHRQPLGQVLSELLEAVNLGYQVVNGQVVLTQKTGLSTPLIPPDSAQDTRASGQAGSPLGSLPQVGSALPATPNTRRASFQQLPPVVITPPVATNNSPMQHLPEQLEGVAASPAITPEAAGRERKKNRRAAEKKFSRNIREALNQLMQSPPPDTSGYLHRRFHVGLVYPISTNGQEASHTVNQVSLHLLAGYSAGLKGVEFSGLGNVEKNYVQGAQFAGLFNLVKHRVNGVQAAGLVNVNGGNTRGAQLAGGVNLNNGRVAGVQATGLVNIATDAVRGGQLSGFTNLLIDSLRGVQATGVVNIATQAVHGAQLSGLANYAQRVKGLQAAGGVNVATSEVRGAQIAGLVNYAGFVKGVQIGLFNIADSINGVPLGLFSLVRKNGYRRLELWYSEALQANVAFKMGVPRFYNMLLVGSDVTSADFRWGFGYGLGTSFPITPAFSMNLDLYTMQIHENDRDFLSHYALNLLNTARLSLNLHLGKRVALFVAPTFNVMVSEYQQPDNGTVGSRIAPAWTFYDRTFENIDDTKLRDGRPYAQLTSVKMWLGFQTGLRF